MISTGIDELCRIDFAPIRGARIGIVTNHTAINRWGNGTVNVILEACTAEVKALFSPEHGLRGQASAGELVTNGADDATGLPVYSLYGTSRRPTPEMLEELDALVFDIQDIGARFYTYMTTMAYCLEACATNGLKFVVLDRPNPITGSIVEGPIIEDLERSFIGYLKVPIRHGMTPGELALYHRAESKINVDLEVVPVNGWKRSQWFDETGLAWTRPSPAMKSMRTAVLYPGVCLLEATNVSVGRGTPSPFEMVGAPWIDEDALCDDLRGRELLGVEIEPIAFSPEEREYKDDVCHGVVFNVTDREILMSVELGLHLLDAIHRQNPVEFQFERIFRHIGNRNLIEQLQTFTPAEEIVADWRASAEEFREERAQYLLYV